MLMKKIALMFVVVFGLSGCIVVDDGPYAASGFGFGYSAVYSVGGPLFGPHHHSAPPPRPRPRPMAERAPFEHPGAKPPAKPPRIVAASKRGLPPTIR